MKTKSIIIALVALALSACASSPEVTSTPPVSEQAAPAQETTASSTAAETSSVSTADVKASELASQLQEMQKNSIYFDFNEFVVKPEFRDVLLQNANVMKANSSVVVTLEGNADERGSSEYNLALGDKRANTVRKSLNMLGVSDDQIKTVSLGEEHPKLTCHEEQCWKENRRVDFKIKSGS